MLALVTDDFLLTLMTDRNNNRNAQLHQTSATAELFVLSADVVRMNEFVGWRWRYFIQSSRFGKCTSHCGLDILRHLVRKINISVSPKLSRNGTEIEVFGMFYSAIRFWDSLARHHIV